MFVQATVMAFILLTLVESRPCDNPKFKESMHSQCIELLGDGEAQLRSGEKDKNGGDLEIVKDKYASAFQKLKQGLALCQATRCHCISRTCNLTIFCKTNSFFTVLPVGT